MKDLVVLVADKNIEFIIKGLFPRLPMIEKINIFTYDIFVHPFRDPGIVNGAHEFLRPFHGKYSNALVLFDYEGSGQEHEPVQTVQNKVQEKLYQTGWAESSRVIAISPELENWVWVNETILKEIISWQSDLNIYDWLETNGYKDKSNLKPNNPKEAFEACLKKCRTPRSSSIYQQIGNRASYRNCIDESFKQMINQISTWYQMK